MNDICDRLKENGRFVGTGFVYPTADEFYDILGYSTSQIHQLLDSRVNSRRFYPNRQPRDAWFNQFVPVTSGLPYAHMDIQPVLSMAQMANYLCKYTCKGEPSVYDDAVDEGREVHSTAEVDSKQPKTTEKFTKSRIAENLHYGKNKIPVFSRVWIHNRTSNGQLRGASWLEKCRHIRYPSSVSSYIVLRKDETQWCGTRLSITYLSTPDASVDFDDDETFIGQVVNQIDDEFVGIHRTGRNYEKGNPIERHFRRRREFKTLNYNFRAMDSNHTDKSLYIFFHPWREAAELKVFPDCTKPGLVAGMNTHQQKCLVLDCEIRCHIIMYAYMKCRLIYICFYCSIARARLRANLTQNQNVNPKPITV